MTESNGNSQPQPAPVPKCGAPGEKFAYLFVPQDDITARELASAMEIVMFGFASMIGAAPRSAVDLLYQALDEQTRRHWLVQKLPEASPLVVARRANGGGPLQLPPGARN